MVKTTAICKEMGYSKFLHVRSNPHRFLSLLLYPNPCFHVCLSHTHTLSLSIFHSITKLHVGHFCVQRAILNTENLGWFFRQKKKKKKKVLFMQFIVQLICSLSCCIILYWEGEGQVSLEQGEQEQRETRSASKRRWRIIYRGADTKRAFAGVDSRKERWLITQNQY